MTSFQSEYNSSTCYCRPQLRVIITWGNTDKSTNEQTEEMNRENLGISIKSLHQGAQWHQFTWGVKLNEGNNTWEF